MNARLLIGLLGLLPALAWAATAVDTAQRQIEAQDLGGAWATLHRYLASTPDDTEARFLMARVLAWQGRPQEALIIYEALLHTDSDNVDYLFAQGQALLWSGQLQAAIKPLEHAASLAPRYELIRQTIEQTRASLTSPMTATTPSEIPIVAVRRQELEISSHYDWLDRPHSDWQGQRLDYSSTQPDGIGWYGALLRERRFNTWDQGGEIGTVIPLSSNWTLQPEVGAQESPHFLPRWYVDLRSQHRFNNGILGAFSIRRTQYESLRTDRLALGLEHYGSSWHASYTLNLTHVDNVGTPVSHDASFDYYYNGLSYAGMRLARGEEEEIAENGRPLNSYVSSLSLQGRHWLNDRWAVSWTLGLHQQGNFYEQTWLQVGLRRAF